MNDKAKYCYVVKYKVQLKCITPMHIGSGDSINGEILIHPVTGIPFVQGTSLAGIFSEYVRDKKGDEVQKYLFGDALNDELKERKSKVIFSDAQFQTETVMLEERTRVRINDAAGSVEGAVVTGREMVSGQLLKTEYVSQGAKLFFEINMLLPSIGESAGIIEECLNSLGQGRILIGGQLSNGCGQVVIEKIERADYDLKSESGRAAWRKEGSDGLHDITEDVKKGCGDAVSGIYEVLADVVLDRSVMVKGTYVKNDLLTKEEKESAQEIPDAMSITNGNNDYILPGSSIKGTLRSRIESIADYLHIDKKLLEDFFEEKPRLYFEDAVIGVNSARSVTRIHINKFTGGVMNGAKFKDKVVDGECRLRIRIKKEVKSEEAQAMCALLLLALRDLSIGAVNFGSGASIGRGFTDVTAIIIKEDGKVAAELKPKDASMQDDSKFIQNCIKALKNLGGRKL